MAELNRSEVMKQIFAQAQKLMIAQQAAAIARLDEEQATAELVRLNGSTTVDLATDNGRRFFECEGSMETRLKYGHDVSPEQTKCGAIVAVASYFMDRQTKRPEQTPLCEDCQNAERLRKADAAKPVVDLTAGAHMDEEPSF